MAMADPGRPERPALPVRIQRRVSGLGGWHRLALAFASGAMATVAQTPLYLTPALVIAFSLLVWLLDGTRGARSSFAVGWAFGFGYFGFGLYWISFALFVDAGRTAWMLPFAALGLPAVFALYPALAAMLARKVAWEGPLRVVSLAVAWTAAEWVRGHFATGFPWNLAGYAVSASDAFLQTAAVVGAYGVSFLAVLAAAAPAALADLPGAEGDASPGRVSPSGRRFLFTVAAGICVIWGAGAARVGSADDTTVAGVLLRLVQAGVPQKDKWEDALREAHLRRHFQLSSSAGAGSVTHVIWSETAVPYFLGEDPTLARLIGGLARPDGAVLVGAPRAAPRDDGSFRIWNSLFVIDPEGEIVATYDKAHLLPFGEYVPFRSVLQRLGVERLASGQGDFNAGAGPRTIDVPGAPPVSPLICYEAIFPGDVVPAGARPGWLLNLTNDAWFGQTAGPHQHFEMARMRAAETGLPLVRVANTGISGVIDAYGRVRATLPLGASGVLDHPLPVALPDGTVYGRIGDAGMWGLLVFSVLVTTAARRLERRRKQIHVP
jgi:apolipoprotein N-acyltransferase